MVISNYYSIPCHVSAAYQLSKQHKNNFEKQKKIRKNKEIKNK